MTREIKLLFSMIASLTLSCLPLIVNEAFQLLVNNPHINNVRSFFYVIMLLIHILRVIIPLVGIISLIFVVIFGTILIKEGFRYIKQGKEDKNAI